MFISPHIYNQSKDFKKTLGLILKAPLLIHENSIDLARLCLHGRFRHIVPLITCQFGYLFYSRVLRISLIIEKK